MPTKYNAIANQFYLVNDGTITGTVVSSTSGPPVHFPQQKAV